MKPVSLLIATAALLGAAACSQSYQETGQSQAAQGDLQLPGQRPAASDALAVPPNEFDGPARASVTPTQTANASQSDSTINPQHSKWQSWSPHGPAQQ